MDYKRSWAVSLITMPSINSPSLNIYLLSTGAVPLRALLKIVVVAQVCPTLCILMDCLCQASMSFTIFQSLLKLKSIKCMMPSNHLVLCHPLLLPSIFPSIRVFSSELVLRIRWPKYWSFSFSISPSNEYSELISFRVDWFDLLAVQEALKSLLQHPSSKASVLQCSGFFVVQFSHPYITTGRPQL